MRLCSIDVRSIHVHRFPWPVSAVSEEIRIARGPSKFGGIIRIDRITYPEFDNIYFRGLESIDRSCLIALLFGDFDSE